MNKAQRKPIEAGASDRVVTSTDNMRPDDVPLMLAGVDDLPAIMKPDVDKLVNDAILQLSTYGRVPEVIESDDVYERVVTVSTHIKTVVDEIEAKRTAHKRPYLDASNAIDQAFKLPYVAPDAPKDTKPRTLKTELDAAHKALKGRLSARDTAKHREEQARLAEEQERLAEAAARDGIDLGSLAAPAAAPITTKSTHGGMAVKSIVRQWKVVDAEKLPRSLLMPDPAAIQRLVDGGAKSIPGVEIEEVVDTHTKRR